MGFFSFFSTDNDASATKSLIRSKDFHDYFTKDFFNEIVNHSSSMILYFTKQDGWIGANKVFFETMGFGHIGEFRRQHESIREIFLSESEEIFTEDDKSWLDYIKRYKNGGYSITISTFDAKILSIQARCYTSSYNQEIYVLELQNVTALHQAEIHTKEIELLKTKFLANIGHEFRTPMNGILGFLELLDKTTLDKKQREYLNMINKSSRNLMTNIETLLDLSQMEGGRLGTDNLSFELLPEMEKIANSFFAYGRSKGVNLLAFIDPKLPRELMGDIKKINQIMGSLVQNAVKFTPRGGKVIMEVKLLKRQLSGECNISFSVKDNGNGIAQEQLALIAEPFTASNLADERLGIGLSLSNGLVKLLGSELRIQSEKGNGTYFNFILNFKESHGQSFKMTPKQKVKVLLLEQAKVDDANSLTTYLRSFAIDVIKSNMLDENIYEDIDVLYIVGSQNDSSWMFKLASYSKKAHIVFLLNDGEKLQTKLTHVIDEVLYKPLLASQVAKHLYAIYKIETEENKESKLLVKEKSSALVVEDNLINQRLIQILLQEYNIAVSTASNGVEAVSMCQKNRYDIVFMDIDMPQKNGIVATKEIKEAANPNGQTPIVALTALAMEGDREMLLKAGLDDYIAKPLTREKLENILNAYLKVIPGV